MELLLDALRTTIKANLAYLHDVVVVDHEDLVPETIPYPFVGLKDESSDYESKPDKHDLETLRVVVIVYQSIILNEPGAALMGASASLGTTGKGLLAISKELRTLLNDNYLGVAGVCFAHCDRRDGTEARVLNSTDYHQICRLHFRYKRYTT